MRILLGHKNWRAFGVNRVEGFRGDYRGVESEVALGKLKVGVLISRTRKVVWIIWHHKVGTFCIMSSFPDCKNLNDALYLLNKRDDPNADSLLFHGVVLERDEQVYKKTWMTRSSNLSRPAWFPQKKERSRARMFFVMYDASAKKAGDQGRFNMRTLVEYLVVNFTELESESIGQRGSPVILVGQDLGGLVIKELCLYLLKEISLEKHKGSDGRYSFTSELSVMRKNFLKSLAGIFYFATPHQGLQFVVDDMIFEGGLLPNLEIVKADVARSDNDFRKLRQTRNWMTRGVGPALEDTEIYLHVSEASMRYDTDGSNGLGEHWEYHETKIPSIIKLSVLRTIDERLHKSGLCLGAQESKRMGLLGEQLVWKGL